MYENGLFIFRRDLRIVDNTALQELSNICKNIYTIFIFTPEQVGSGNSFKSDNSVQFMIESLDDLSNEIHKQGGKLLMFYGHNEKVVSYCIKKLNINIVRFNCDYTPYAIKRDFNIISLCEKLGVLCGFDHDYYLHEPGSILSGSRTPYQKFTPYYNTCMKKKVRSPSNARIFHFKSQNISNTITIEQAFKKFTKINGDILVHGGRINGLKQIHITQKSQKQYSKTRDNLFENTSLLSAYIKFGCVSIREVYKAFRSNHAFIRQLIWRDFYAQILYSFPYVLGSAMKENYNKIKWHYNASWFNKWTKGETGFPVVDACMRQLNETGYMHNRGRLIVASFLVKTLLISWEKGEKYFATRLTDYDPASNNLNWQWCASSAVDSQPYFRIFNPFSQQKEHDPDCEYIRQWIPELRDVDPKIIHNWETEWVNHKEIKYPKPICNYTEQREKALQMYKEIY
jgi:deoxyribodipyrimidine photo-lyase